MLTYVSTSSDCLDPEMEAAAIGLHVLQTSIFVHLICNAYWSSFYIFKNIGSDHNIVFVTVIFISTSFFIICVQYYRRKEEFMWLNLSH